MSLLNLCRNSCQPPESTHHQTDDNNQTQSSHQNPLRISCRIRRAGASAAGTHHPQYDTQKKKYKSTHKIQRTRDESQRIVENFYSHAYNTPFKSSRIQAIRVSHILAKCFCKLYKIMNESINIRIERDSTITYIRHQDGLLA